MRTLYLFFFFVVCLGIMASVSLGQSNTVSKVTVQPVTEGEDALITIELFQGTASQEVSLYYKSPNESEWKKVEIGVSGRSATATIPGASVIAPFIEYYLEIKLPGGVVETFPNGAPSQVPADKLTVMPLSPKDKEVFFLSPEKGKLTGESEFFISVSLLRASAAVKKDATRLYVDETEITGYALFAEDMILVSPDNLPQKFSQGAHRMRVELYDTTNQLYHTLSSSFTLVSDQVAEEVQSAFSSSGSILAENRYENVSSTTNTYNNIRINANGSYKSWELSTEAYISSEEKSNLQPVNRYSIGLRSDWLELSVGDNTPQFPSLLLNGKRVRGFSGALNLGFFNLQASFGEINRPIEGEHIKLLTRQDTTLLGNVVDIDSLKFPGYNRAQLKSFGTYKRNLIAVRPSFGRGQNFQFGLSYLHGKDEMSSINFSSRPQENLVLGTDLLIGFDDQHVLLTGQAAVSVSNSDISRGSFSDSALVSFLEGQGTVKRDANGKIIEGGDEYDTWKKIVDQASEFMTINQFIKPLNPEKFASLATEAALAINYFGNYLRGGYIYRGNDFQSFGNNYMRTDIAGINITDRLRLFENRVFLSGAYENLKDNLQSTKQSTTTFKTMTGSLAIYPRIDLPSFILTYTLSDNENDAKPTDATKIKDQTNRISAQVSYDFKWKFKHQVSFGFGTSNRDDQSTGNRDVKNLSVNFYSETMWSDNLASNFNLIMNNSVLTVSPTQEDKLNYFTVRMGGRYALMQKKLLLNGFVNPSFGDFKRLGFDLSAMYFFLKNFSAELMLRYLLNSQVASGSANNDMIIGLVTRYGW